ncbi:MAG TPA: hypothetical protein VMQ54_14945 [Steroidobacteraceae bacterium]|nr:hypothetical protein [Steroidobacteraceae bacterium]
MPSLLTLGAPYTVFNPKSGIEGAAGFDYLWPNQPWYFVFDVRYGQTKTATANSSSFHSSIIFPFGTPSFAFAQTTTTADQGTEKESHFVADFMIGRDLGVGSNAPELMIGLRVVDLRATASVTATGQHTFYSSSVTFGPHDPTVALAANGAWTSSFFGGGPRVAIAGGVPIIDPWSFDYGAGIAGLIGNRTFNFVVSGTNGFFSGDTNSPTGILNVDGSAALSYRITPAFKISAGVRADYYSTPLTTYNISTGAQQNIDRLYWGPFVRLTGAF